MSCTGFPVHDMCLEHVSSQRVPRTLPPTSCIGFPALWCSGAQSTSFSTSSHIQHYCFSFDGIVFKSLRPYRLPLHCHVTRTQIINFNQNLKKHTVQCRRFEQNIVHIHYLYLRKQRRFEFSLTAKWDWSTHVKNLDKIIYRKYIRNRKDATDSLTS